MKKVDGGPSIYEQYQTAAKMFKEEAANMKYMKKYPPITRVRVSRGMHFSEDRVFKPRKSPKREKKKPFQVLTGEDTKFMRPGEVRDYIREMK